LGASGSVEAIFSILSIKFGEIPPTLNLNNISESCKGINLVPHESLKENVDISLSNSFGFGGTNVSLLFKRI
jgi:3-oxoacyl-[acyl-carrier-protein] synthase II